MNKETLKKLGLEDKPDPDNYEEQDPIHKDFKGEQVLDGLDEWDKSKGDELVTTLKEKIGKQEATNITKWARTLADFHASAFKPEPTIGDWECQEPRRKEFMSQMMETPEYKNLHKSTKLHKLASEMATAAFADQYAKLIQQDEKVEEKRKKKKKRDKEKEQIDDELALVRRAGAALEHADENVQDMLTYAEALGHGTEDGTGAQYDYESMIQMFQEIRKSPRLQNIMKRAGRWKRTAQTQQYNKVLHGRDDVVGVELSGDISRLVPFELSMIADPDLELDAMRRLVEQQSMSRRYQGIKQVGRGPIIACFDGSGSMAGENIVNAKAMALAMYWIARHQRRFISLTEFSSSNQYKTILLEPKEIVPGKDGDGMLLEWLNHFFNGGTDLHGPLLHVKREVWPMLLHYEKRGYKLKGKIDHIIVTDGLVGLPAAMEKEYMEWKLANEVKTTIIAIGCSPGPLKSISDEVFEASSVDINGEGFLRALSI